jgi:WD40 repeat protein
MSSNGRYLVYDLSDTIVRIIDYENRTFDSLKLNWQHKWHTSVCVSPENDKFFIVGVSENGINEFGLFTFNSGNKLYSFFDSTSSNQGLEASKDSQYVLSIDNKELRLFRINWNPTVIKEKDKEEPKFYFTISPNPASDYIEIDINDVILSEAKNLGMSIYDVLGVEVYCSIATPPAPSQEGGKTRFDVSHLSPGVYFVRVGDVVSKFIKI